MALLSKIVPASFLTNILAPYISIIQDAINTFLADNHKFINQILFETESFGRDSIIMCDKTKTLSKK